MYIVSQFFVVISYVLLAITYCLKNRKSILLFNFVSLLTNAAAFALLGAWSGFAMNLIAVVRNIIFLIQNKKDNLNITYVDWIILGTLYLMSGVSSYFTYVAFYSLLSVFATMLYTYSVWQKNTRIYKLLGVPTSLLWVCYNIFVKSLFGVILELLLLICEIVEIIIELKKKNIVKKELTIDD